MGVNTHYKDSVFSFLFSNPGILRELYGAIEGVELPEDVRITINTLEGVLFRTRLNDISFEVGETLVVLIEHQSTVNPNMTLRLLLYIARVYEKLLGSKNIYGGKRLKLPRPEFIVLYNGEDPCPDEQTLRLSDLFADPSSLGISKEAAAPALELTARVYNINAGHNADKLKRSQTLNGYSVFVAKAREFEAETAQGRKISELSEAERREAMTNAVKWCIEHETLKEFLTLHGSEVINMLLDEWDLDTALKVEREEGIEVGIVVGREEGIVVGIEKGMIVGREEGIVVGREEGIEAGREDDARNALALGLSVDMVQKITGLDTKTIQELVSSTTTE
jgi:hypothetical protein